MVRYLIVLLLFLFPARASAAFSLEQFALDVGKEILKNSAELGPKRLCKEIGGEVVLKLICAPLIDAVIKQAPELIALKEEKEKPDDIQAQLAAKLVAENPRVQQEFFRHIEQLNAQQQSQLYGQIKGLRKSVEANIAQLRTQLLAQHQEMMGQVEAVEKQATLGAERSKIIIGKVDAIQKQMIINNNRSRMISDLREFKDVLIDGSEGIVMVPVPDGDFLYGNQKRDSKGNHRVRHKIHVKRFSISKYEISFEQYNLFARSTGREEKFKGCLPTDRPAYRLSWGADENPCPTPRRYQEGIVLPVFWVSFEDAQHYAEWISEVTGVNYRLPSHAEWQYAALAGENGDFYWERGFSNILYDNKIYKNIYHMGNLCTELPTYKNHSCYVDDLRPIGQYPPNPWGLYDMVGNVSEWTLDCPPKDQEGFQTQTKNGGAVTDCWDFNRHHRIHAGGSLAKSMTWDGGWQTGATLDGFLFEEFSNSNKINQFIGIRLVREVH